MKTIKNISASIMKEYKKRWTREVAWNFKYILFLLYLLGVFLYVIIRTHQIYYC